MGCTDDTNSNQLHSQSQEELRSLASELNSKVEIMGNVESRKQALEDEVHRAYDDDDYEGSFCDNPLLEKTSNESNLASIDSHRK
ncbi:hypothetical protein JHK85_022820 [Glycine max]|nr:hypothetical protein JHK85_022820 [Glycine max]